MIMIINYEKYHKGGPDENRKSPDFGAGYGLFEKHQKTGKNFKLNYEDYHNG